MDALAALRTPVPTAQKRAAAHAARLQALTPERLLEPRTAPVVLPPLDVAALQRQYDPARAHAPRLHEGTFQVPLGISARAYEHLRNQAVQRFVESLAKQGWELVQDYRIQVYPGVYPARDLASGVDLLDRRDMIVRAHFRFRNPQPLRIELPPHLLEPRVLAA